MLIGTPADNDVLTYDTADGKWKPAAGGGGGGLTFAQILAALDAIGVTIDDTTGTTVLHPSDTSSALLTLEAPAGFDADYFQALDLKDENGNIVTTLSIGGDIDVLMPAGMGGGAGWQIRSVDFPNNRIHFDARLLFITKENTETGAYMRLRQLNPGGVDTGDEFRIDPKTRIGMSNVSGAPADGDIDAGMFFLWPDATNGAPFWRGKGKTLDGTVVSFAIPDGTLETTAGSQAKVDTHVNDTADAHDASAISVDSATLAGTGTDVQAVLEELDDAIAGAGAPTTADYLVGTAQGGLSAEIVVGTSPGGELGGTWASPTVDATHSGSTHAAVQAAAEATAAAALSDHLTDAADAHDASAISILDAASDFTATEVEGALAELQTADEADEAALAAHLADTSAAHAASAVSVDSTTLEGTGTDVQAVFEELDNSKSNKLLLENLQTDSYTLVLGDADLAVVINKATAVNLTVPLNSSVAYPIGTVIPIHQRGAGQVTVVATGGVTINSPSDKKKLTGQYSSGALRKYGTDTWVLTGDLAA